MGNPAIYTGTCPLGRERTLAWAGQQQVGSLLKDGSYEPKIPYTKDPEPLMDILNVWC